VLACDAIRGFYLVTPEMDYIKLTVHSYRKIQETVNIDIVSHLLHSFMNLSVSAVLVISALLKVITRADCHN
jgi:hypothetical protein